MSSIENPDIIIETDNGIKEGESIEVPQDPTPLDSEMNAG